MRMQGRGRISHACRQTDRVLPPYSCMHAIVPSTDPLVSTPAMPTLFTQSADDVYMTTCTCTAPSMAHGRSIAIARSIQHDPIRRALHTPDRWVAGCPRRVFFFSNTDVAYHCIKMKKKLVQYLIDMDRSDVLFWPLPFSLRADDTCNYVALMLSYLYLTRMHTWHEFSFIRCAYMEEAFSWSVVLQLISDHDWPAVSQQCHAFLFSILASQSASLYRSLLQKH